MSANSIPVNSSSMRTTEASPSLYMGLIFYDKASEKTLYTQAKINFAEDSASLVFKASLELFPEMKRYFQEKDYPAFGDKKSPGEQQHIMIGYADKPMKYDDSLLKAQKVQRILVNYKMPPFNFECLSAEDKLYALSISKIGDACQKVFPNLKPTESAYLVHIGSQRYGADTHLFCDASSPRLEQKS